jgi:hypothetical protein
MTIRLTTISLAIGHKGFRGSSRDMLLGGFSPILVGRCIRVLLQAAISHKYLMVLQFW